MTTDTDVPAPAAPMTVLAVADSDSCVRLSAAMLDALPDHHTVGLAVVRSPIAPSPAQTRAAVRGTRQSGRRIPVLSASELRRLIRRRRPDVVILNCAGPVVDVLTHILLHGRARRGARRPVLVSALPGISVPATEKAWFHRSQVDLFVLHSHREVAEFTALGEKLGATGEVGLATLPFLSRPRQRRARPHRVVFAAQAGVPETREDRERVLVALAELSEDRPDLEVVVKLRGRENEARTHRELHHYEALWRALVEEERARDHTLVFRTGAMADQLERARGLVTVSSTAALEAIASGVPVAILTDVGAGAEQTNTVFEASGVLGTLDDVRSVRFRAPHPEWSERNYFHPASDNDWVDRLTVLVARASRGGLGAHPPLLDPSARRPARRRALLGLSVPSRAVRGIGDARRGLRARLGGW